MIGSLSVKEFDVSSFGFMSFKAAPVSRVGCRVPFFSRQDGILVPWGTEKYLGLPIALNGIVTLDNCWEEKWLLWCKSVCGRGSDRIAGWYQPQHLVSNPALPTLTKQLPYWITVEITGACCSSGQGWCYLWHGVSQQYDSNWTSEKGKPPSGTLPSKV